MNNKLVGVIGGLGPMATVSFCKLVIDNTKAQTDQDHVNMIVNIMSDTPDRTAYILDNSNESPLPSLIESAKKLEKSGCDFLVMPCNTASFFYEEINKNINIQLLNIVTITLEEVKNCKKIGLMATDGTIKSKTYQKYSDKIFIPEPAIQNKIMDIIYNKVKKGIKANKEDFNIIIDYFKKNNCDKVITGCTELSVIVEYLNIEDDYIIDSLKCLALKTIELSGKKLK